LLRRAVSKKKREVLDKEREHFAAGCIKQGYTLTDANKVYDMIVRFANYGFPKAHATAYGVLAYQTAYLHTHYPTAFMAAMLTANMGSHRKVAEYVDECRRSGITVLPPDVNESGVTFTPIAQHGRIRFGLAAIKNVGTQAIEAIIQARREGPYADLLDFCRRVDLRVCNKRVVESLIQAGAFDSLPIHRAQAIAVLDHVVETALKWKKERDDLQLHLFGLTEEVNWTIDYPDIRPYTNTEQLDLEREMLGLFLSGHPLDDYENLIHDLDIEPISYLADLPEGRDAVIAGMVVSLKEIVSKKGQQMAFIEVEDRIDKVEVVLFPTLWRTAKSQVAKGSLLVLRGKVQQEEEASKLLADQVVPLTGPDAKRETQALLRGMGGYRPEARSGGGRSAAGVAGAGASPANTRQAPAGSAGKPAGQSAASPANARQAPDTARGQRVYVKIAGSREDAELLTQLQTLLQANKGGLPVVLFYERQQKTLALSAKYNVKPSPELIQEIDRLLGAGSAKVN